jgi:Do/DeqQ family serine protease
MNLRPATALTGVVLALVLGLVACRTPGALGVQEDFRQAARSVLPTVVKIDVLEQPKDQAPASDSQPFFDFFFDNPDGQRQDRPYQQESLGSGIIVGRDGTARYVVTNAHVIADAQDIKVTLDDGRVFPAALVGRDERKDVALLRFDAGPAAIPVAALGDSDALRVGDWVLAMGAPYGYQSSVSVGIVSALHRRGGPSGNINDFIQTDAAINKGNSGGALVDAAGRLVGINTWITSQTGDSVGLGFAIPINNLKQALRDFIEVGHIRYGWLGVSVYSLDDAQAASLGLGAARGALVGSVYRNSPADLAGLRPGDVVQAIGKRPIPDADELIQLVGEIGAGQVLDLQVWRAGVAKVLKADVTARLPEAELARQSASLWPGVAVYPLNQKVREELELAPDAKGLIVRQVIAQSPAQLGGLKTRDLLVRLNGQELADMAGFYTALAAQERGAELKLDIIRDGKPQTIPLNMEMEGKKQQ